MNSVSFNEEKAIAVILYILKSIGGQIDMYRLAKILYFADQKHLVTYGRTILGDEYVPMEYGPVPSAIYNAVKMINNDNTRYKLFSKKLQLSVKDGYIRVILSSMPPDMDELSLSDIECLDASIEENKTLEFDDLCKKSHKLAWNTAAEKGLARIRMEDIAREAGASDDFIAYIKDYVNDCNLVLV
ncbi:MAG: SocA family protein [Prevotellaceae bacterium]|jgi:uncharacterized phage-associated protein|nr:SocA family protein [Prevotellaceae bacterium]